MVHGGTMKAPKVLADIVESVIAAVYLDQKFDSKAMWVVCILFPFLAIIFF